MRAFLNSAFVAVVAGVWLWCMTGCDDPFPTLSDASRQQQPGTDQDNSAATSLLPKPDVRPSVSATPTGDEIRRRVGERGQETDEESDYDRRRGTLPPRTSDVGKHVAASGGHAEHEVERTGRRGDDHAAADRHDDDAAGQGSPSTPVRRASNESHSRSGASSSLGPADAPQVRLRTGVALAQTLPSGSAMGFNITYNFVKGSPRASHRYFWLIRRGDGQQAAVPIARLQESGQLATFITSWPPNTGPFECHLVEMLPDGSRRVISPTAALR